MERGGRAPLSDDVKGIHDFLRAALALPRDDSRRLPALSHAVGQLSARQRRLLIDSLRNDDLVRNYRHLYQGTTERPREADADFIQSKYVDYASTQSTQYMLRALTRMKLGDALVGLPIRMVSLWSRGPPETSETRGLYAGDSLEEQLSQVLPCLGRGITERPCLQTVNRQFSYWCPQCVTQQYPEPIRISTQPGNGQRLLVETERWNPDRVIEVTEVATEMDASSSTETARRVRQCIYAHIPVAFDKGLTGPLCGRCMQTHTDQGCRPRIWLRGDHEDPTLPPIHPRESLYATELEEELLSLQDRVGLSTIILEDHLFTRRRVRREVRKEPGVKEEEDLKATTEYLYNRYQEYRVRYRRAQFLGNAA